MPTSFTYDPFTNGKTQFRLLDLLPGPGSIRCNLRVVSIETLEPYEALSYCWGPPTPKRTISVNGKAFLTGANLYTALLYLREDGERRRSRTIWIDAICINQESTYEKNVCIPQMRDIYQGCWRTVIWLGEHDWLTKSAFDGVRFLSTKFGGDDVVRYYDWRRIRRSDGQQGEGLLGTLWRTAEHLHAVAAFNSVFGRAWFSRLWVIQELALSRYAVFVCGDYQVDWDDISRAQAVSSAFIDGVSVMRLYRDSPGSGVHNILDCMLASWTRIATKPKDKIYGLLALASNDDPVIPVEVDYSLNDAELFTRFTTTYIEHTGDVRILTISRGCRTRDATTPDIPSWVIDYQNYYSGTPALISWTPDDGAWSAGGNNRCKSIINGDFFGAQGYEFDVVCRVSSISKIGCKKVRPSYITGVISSFVSAAGFSRFYLDAKKMVSETNPESSYRHGGNTAQTTLEAFWQTLEMHHGATTIGGPNERPRDTKIREGVDRLLSRHARLVVLDNLAGFVFSLALYLVVLIMNCFGDVFYTEFFAWSIWAKQRRFFTTEKGYFGLGPGETRVGDKIVLLQGGPVPIIIRPGEPSCIVGESYVQGIMEGEVFDKDKCYLLWCR